MSGSGIRRRGRLRKAVGYAVVRGAGYATGYGLAAAAVWWLTHHHVLSVVLWWLIAHHA